MANKKIARKPRVPKAATPAAEAPKPGEPGGESILPPMTVGEAAKIVDAWRASENPHRISNAFVELSTEAVAFIDEALGDIVDSWSLRDEKPDGSCLMSALANLREARRQLRPEPYPAEGRAS